jgi:hypothetical protein
MRLVIFGLFISSFAFAQTFQGTLRGRVLDPNGAATTTAAITLTDEDTSVSRRTVTSDQGEYAFSSVTASTYTVSVESPGFRHLEQHGVTIATQAVVTLDLTLQLGQVTEQAAGLARGYRVVLQKAESHCEGMSALPLRGAQQGSRCAIP